MIQENIPVLIVGGGIVGLSAALFLQKHDVPFLLVERHAGTSIHPRARGVNARTMELYREVGVDQEIRTAGAALAPAIGLLTGQTLVEALKSWTPDLHKGAMALMGSWGVDISPTTASRCTQDLLEPVLLNAARERGGDLRFSHELIDFAQHDGIVATIVERESGIQHSIHAQYMIAADGARSPVRTALGAKTVGSGKHGHLLNILFRADLRSLVAGHEFSLCRIDRSDMQGLFSSLNNADYWAFQLAYDPTKGESPEDFPPERCRDLLRQAIGQEDLEIEIRGILPWEVTACVAERFQHGRIFLAGDAAHQMPPWRGQGANTGVQDVHNLAWKLAAVLHGQASPALLETYDAERQPIGLHAAETSASQAGAYGLPVFRAPTGPASGKPAGGPGMDLKMFGFGYQYVSQAVLSEGEPVPVTEIANSDGQPGTRVPHAWIEFEGQRLSTVDLSGTRFLLLAGSQGEAWCEAAHSLAYDQKMNLVAYTVGPHAQLCDEQDLWRQAAGIEPSGALLVRPDGFVAWRAREAHGDLRQVLKHVWERIIPVKDRESV